MKSVSQSSAGSVETTPIPGSSTKRPKRTSWRKTLVCFAVAGLCQSSLAADFSANVWQPDEVSPAANVVSTASCQEPCSFDTVYEPVVLPCQTVCSRWEASLDFLYLKVHQRGLDFAISTDGSAALGTGDVHNLDYDRDFGMRGSFGYRTKTGWTLRFAATHLDTDGIAYAERPADPGRLFVTRSQPDGSQESETARAVSNFDYTLFDLIAERPIFQNNYSQIDVFGGVRFADIRQNFRYTLDGRDFADGLIADRTSMDGFGLRFGGQGRWNLAGGFSVFGSMGAGITYGRFHTHFYESNLGDTFVITDVRDSYDQAIINVDAQLGVSKCFGPVRIGAGYEMSNWLNLADRGMFTEDIQRGTYAPISQDILLEGLFVQLEYVR